MGFVSLDREIQILSTSKTAITAGESQAGWVSGTPASVAASGTFTASFDLGPEWMHYPYVRLYIHPVAPHSGWNPIQIYSGDTLSSTSRRLGFIDMDSVSTTYLNISVASGPQTVDLRPMGRYLTVTGTNADGANASGSTSRIDVAMYPF